MHDDPANPSDGATGEPQGSRPTSDRAQPVPDPDATRTVHHEPTAAAEHIGHYRLLEKIGAGGMGEVYRAEQTEPIRRTVALKVIKRGMDTDEVMRRFEAERQALALMDHPNIAKVFDAGSTPAGRPYFVMEHVRGEPITSYADKQRLSTRERLQLFIQLCEGVQHAHQKAIIHRDLKPSNVLVTVQESEPIPKIIDFGVAKAVAQKLTEKTMYTAVGELIGTPEYMSPEQAEMTGADVDTRTDVYSLGVILYELLTGALPFDPQELRKAGFGGIVQMIRERDPVRPSTKVSTLGERTTGVAEARRTIPAKLGGQLRGDLDWITMKALEKDRTRRYASAAEMAEDVRRHLRHEPVLASPPSAAYRARKFVRRHRVGVSFAAVVVVLLAGFAVTMGVQAGRIALERDRANLEADGAREVTDFLVGLFDVSDPRVARGDTITAREILESGAEKVSYELREQPLLRARMLEAMGRVYQNMALYDQADEFFQGALDLRQTTLGDQHADVAKSLSALGWLRHYQERFKEGRTLVESALRIQRQVLPPDHIDTAWSLYFLGATEGRMGEFTSAREHLEKARAIFEKREGPYSLAVSWCWQDLAASYYSVGDNAKVLECYKRALAVKERILPPDHPDIALSIEGVGIGLTAVGNYSEAMTTLQRALEIFETTSGKDHFDTGRCNNQIGWTLRLAGRFDEAKPYLEQALRVYRLALGEEGYAVANVLDELGLLEHHAGLHSEAESLYARALPMMEKAVAPGSGTVDLVALLQHRATCLRELNREAQAESLEARAGTIQEELDRQRAKPL